MDAISKHIKQSKWNGGREYFLHDPQNAILTFTKASTLEKQLRAQGYYVLPIRVTDNQFIIYRSQNPGRIKKDKSIPAGRSDYYKQIAKRYGYSTDI